MDPSLDYDSLIWRACPTYNEGRWRVQYHLPSSAKHIVSLGTGTGNLEDCVLSNAPRVTMHGFDNNEDYLRIAQDKLDRWHPGRFTGTYADIRHIQLPRADAVISGLTIHHLTDPEKEQLFHNIANALPPNGVFINYDIVKGNTRQEQDQFIEGVCAFMEEQGLPQEFIEDERRIMYGRGENADCPMTLARQRELLENEGFRFSLKWQEELFVVYLCEKV